MAFDPSKPCMTRDGRKARIICRDLKSGVQPIAARYFDGDEEACSSFTLEGGFYEDNSECRLDLINIPEKHVRWIVVGAGAQEVALWVKEGAAEDYAALMRKNNKLPDASVLRIEWEDSQ